MNLPDCQPPSAATLMSALHSTRFLAWFSSALVRNPALPLMVIGKPPGMAPFALLPQLPACVSPRLGSRENHNNSLSPT